MVINHYNFSAYFPYSSDKEAQNSHDNMPYLHRIVSKIQHPEANNKDKSRPHSSALEFASVP